MDFILETIKSHHKFSYHKTFASHNYLSLKTNFIVITILQYILCVSSGQGVHLIIQCYYTSILSHRSLRKKKMIYSHYKIYFLTIWWIISLVRLEEKRITKAIFSSISEIRWGPKLNTRKWGYRVVKTKSGKMVDKVGNFGWFLNFWLLNLVNDDTFHWEKEFRVLGILTQ